MQGHQDRSADALSAPGPVVGSGENLPQAIDAGVPDVMHGTVVDAFGEQIVDCRSRWSEMDLRESRDSASKPFLRERLEYRIGAQPCFDVRDRIAQAVRGARRAVRRERVSLHEHEVRIISAGHGRELCVHVLIRRREMRQRWQAVELDFRFESQFRHASAHRQSMLSAVDQKRGQLRMRVDQIALLELNRNQDVAGRRQSRDLHEICIGRQPNDGRDTTVQGVVLRSVEGQARSHGDADESNAAAFSIGTVGCLAGDRDERGERAQGDLAPAQAR